MKDGMVNYSVQEMFETLGESNVTQQRIGGTDGIYTGKKL